VLTVIGVAAIVHWSAAFWSRYCIWKLGRERKKRTRAVSQNTIALSKRRLKQRISRVNTMAQVKWRVPKGQWVPLFVSLRIGMYIRLSNQPISR
jgi:hypothetical protein